MRRVRGSVVIGSRGTEDEDEGDGEELTQLDGNWLAVVAWMAGRDVNRGRRIAMRRWLWRRMARSPSGTRKKHDADRVAALVLTAM
jgi:hypothetical protein